MSADAGSSWSPGMWLSSSGQGSLRAAAYRVPLSPCPLNPPLSLLSSRRVESRGITMSTELYPVCELQANTTDLQGMAVGGSKPLHRFLRGQPKIVGIIVVILGSSFFILSISMGEGAFLHLWKALPPGFWLGALFIMCGIVYILAEHRPTKKTVSLSLGLSIVTMLASVWVAFMSLLPTIVHSSLRSYEIIDPDDNSTEPVEVDWTAHYEEMTFILEVVFEFYILVCIVLFIVMSSLAGAALRSTKSQALVVMTTKPTE